MVLEGLRQLEEHGVGIGVDHLTLESAYSALDIPRSSSHSAWSTDETFGPQETYQRAVLKAWLLEREKTMFADSAQDAVAQLYADPDNPPSDGSIVRTAIQAAFAAGMAPDGDMDSTGGAYLSTDLALRFAIASQAPGDRDPEVEKWLREGELGNRDARVADSYRPMAQLLEIQPRPEFGESAYQLFGIVVAALVEGIGLRLRIVPELNLDKPLMEVPDGEAPKLLIGICVEAMIPVFFEKVPTE